MKDFLVGVGIGLLGQTAFTAGVGASIRRIDQRVSTGPAWWIWWT